jgi:hypothetical protein
VPIISALDSLCPDKEEIVKGEKGAESIFNLCAIKGTKKGASKAISLALIINRSSMLQGGRSTENREKKYSHVGWFDFA